MMSDRKPRRLTRDEKGALSGFPLIVLTLILLAAALALLAHWFLGGPSIQNGPFPTPVTTTVPVKNDPSQAASDLLKALHDKLQSLDLLKLQNREPRAGSVTVNGKPVSTFQEEYRLPASYSAAQLARSLDEAARPLGAHLAAEPTLSTGDHGQRLYACSFIFNEQWTPVEIDWAQGGAPRICLIIDDAGYQKGEALEHLYGFKVPVTVSIIPHTQFSNALALEFPDNGVEVMCHLPMQGHEKVKPGDYKEYLKRGMNSAKAKEELFAALEDLPHCRGLNNHMGSIATTDLRLMKAVCEGLKEKGMFVIDSRTSARAVVFKAAKATHLPVAQRQTFLDNVVKPSAILKQIHVAAAYAKKHGQAVAIGHFKTITLKTLETAVHQLEKEGFQFVYASEVVKD